MWVVRPFSFLKAYMGSQIKNCLCKGLEVIGFSKLCWFIPTEWVLLEVTGSSKLCWFIPVFFTLGINLPRRLEYSYCLFLWYRCAGAHLKKSYSLISVFLVPELSFALQLSFVRFYNNNYSFLFHSSPMYTLIRLRQFLYPECIALSLFRNIRHLLEQILLQEKSHPPCVTLSITFLDFIPKFFWYLLYIRTCLFVSAL